MKFYIPVFIFCAGFAFTAQAQNNTEKAVNDATQAVGVIKGLFGKKKKDKKDGAVTAADSTKVANSQATNDATATEPKVGLKNQRVYFSGSVNAKTKIIDCDEMWPFNLGAAKIRKGQSYALIDSAGNFIVPFNKYSTIEESASNGVRTGIYHVRNNNTANEYYINSSGKLLWDITANHYNTYSDRLSNDGKFIILQPLKRDAQPNDILPSIIIDKNGKQYHATLKFQYAGLTDSVLVIQEKRLYSFKNLNNVTIVKPSFTNLEEFYNGVAIFEVTNQFGERKVGIINKKGKIVVPPTVSSGSYYRVSSEIGNSDIIEVTGDGNADYIHEYINAVTGKILFKTTRENENIYGEKLTVFPNNYLRSNIRSTDFFIDPLGNIINTGDLVNRFLSIAGPQFAKYKTGAVAFGYKDFLMFYVFLAHTGDRLTAVYNINNGSAIIGPFDMGAHMLQTVDFDPVSHLSLVRFSTGKIDNSNRPVFITGYMNNKGELVMVCGNGG